LGAKVSTGESKGEGKLSKEITKGAGRQGTRDSMKGRPEGGEGVLFNLTVATRV